MVKATHSELIIPDVCKPGTRDYLISGIEVAKTRAGWLEKDVVPFVEIVRELRAVNWQDALAEGEKTWARFCQDLLGFPEAFVAEMEDGVAVLQAHGKTGPIPGQEAREAALGGHGGDRRSESFQGVNGTLKRGSNNGPYLTARLARDHPDIAARLKAGEFRSVRQAAIAAGIVKVPTPLETARKLWAKLSKAEKDEFLDWVGKQGW